MPPSRFIRGFGTQWLEQYARKRLKTRCVFSVLEAFGQKASSAPAIGRDNYFSSDDFCEAIQ